MLLVARKELFTNRVPAVPGGGTISFVNSIEHLYLDDIEMREEGGTPDIVGSIRAGLVFQLKEAVGVDAIRQREESFVARAVASWSANPAIDVLGNHDAERLSIVSFVVRHGEQRLHHNFVVAVLNDLFGIQSRGGCSCAGPYGHILLGIDMETSHAIERQIVEGCSGIKPGWVRVNFNYFISEAVFSFIVAAVDQVATNGWRLLPFYTFDPSSGLWRHRGPTPEPAFSLDSIDYEEGTMRWRRETAVSHSDDDLGGYLADAATLFGRLADDPPPPSMDRMEASADLRVPPLVPSPRRDHPGPVTWRPVTGPVPDWFEESLAAPFTDHVVEVAGVPIHYLDWGTPGLPGLVLVHGGAAHAHWWTFLGPFFAEDWHVVALDLSGHGDSGHRSEYGHETWSDEVMAVAEAAGFTGPPVVVGHSLGGMVTIMAAYRYGDRLAGAVIVDSPVRRPDPESEEGSGGNAFRTPGVYPDLGAALTHFRLIPEQPNDNPWIIDHIARWSLHQTEAGWTWKFDPNLFRRTLSPLRDQLAAARCRVALLRGDRSVVVPPDIADYMYELMGRNAPVISIPEAHHHLLLDQPLAFVAAVRTLLADWQHSIPDRRTVTLPSS